MAFPNPPQGVIHYPAGIAPRINLYFQALTTNTVGFDFSNPAIHVSK